MAISKEITRLPKSAVRVDVTVDGESVRASYNKELAEYCKKIQMPGFRKGKVPQSVIERKLGTEIQKYVKANIIEEKIHELLESEELAENERPLAFSRPKLLDEEALVNSPLDFDTGVKFSLEYDTMPDIEVKNWKGFTVETDTAEVTDADIDKELLSIQERNAIVLDKAEGAQAETNDVVTVNYVELDETGAEKPDTRREDFVFTLGSKLNVYEFDDDITGMKVGEERTFDKIYANDHKEETLKGKKFTLKVKLTALKSRELPELDDDLAQDVDEKFTTLDDLKKFLRERAEKRLAERLVALKTEGVLEKIIAETPVEIPESMIRFEGEQHLRRMMGQYASQDMIDKLLTQDSFLDPMRPSVSKALHMGLIQNKLIKDLNITVSDDEINEKIANLKKDFPEDEQQRVDDYYKEENARAMLVEDLKHEKLRDMFLAENTFTVKNKVSLEEIFKNPEAEQTN